MEGVADKTMTRNDLNTALHAITSDRHSTSSSRKSHSYPSQKIFTSIEEIGILRKQDFTQGVVCILRGVPEHLEIDGQFLFNAQEVPQMQASFIYERFDEVISKFVSIEFSGKGAFSGELVICLPHCMSRSSAIYREPVFKARINGSWIQLVTEEVAHIDDFKDVRFVQTTVSGDLPLYVCVVSRFKKDQLQFGKSASRITSSVDQRLSIKAESGCFTGKQTFPLQVQPIDATAVKELHQAVVNGRALISCSNIVSVGWDGEKFKKPVVINLPIPPNPIKMKKQMQKTEGKLDGEKKKRLEAKDPDATPKPKWYMGIYGEEENDSLFLFNFDQMSESWSHVADVELTEIRKDLLSFQISRPLNKFLVLRTRTTMTAPEARKLIYLLEEQLSLRKVRFLLFQSPKEHADVTLLCLSVNKFDDVYDELSDVGWRFYGSQGPPSSKEISVKEGSIIEIGFRGNIKFDDSIHPPGKRVTLYYNSQINCQVSFTVVEADKHLQRSYDFFKGLCMVKLVDKLTGMDSLIINQAVQSLANPSIIENKRITSQLLPDRNRLLCELMVQLAKEAEYGGSSAQRDVNEESLEDLAMIVIDLDPVYVEAIQIISSKLGKEWEMMGQYLGLPQGRIEAIKMKYKTRPEQARKEMLYAWIKRQPKASDRLPKMYYACMHCGRIDLAYKIEDLYTGADEPERTTSGEPIITGNITAAGSLDTQGGPNERPATKPRKDDFIGEKEGKRDKAGSKRASSEALASGTGLAERMQAASTVSVKHEETVDDENPTATEQPAFTERESMEAQAEPAAEVGPPQEPIAISDVARNDQSVASIGIDINSLPDSNQITEVNQTLIQPETPPAQTLAVVQPVMTPVTNDSVETDVAIGNDPIVIHTEEDSRVVPAVPEKQPSNAEVGVISSQNRNTTEEK